MKKILFFIFTITLLFSACKSHKKLSQKPDTVHQKLEKVYHKYKGAPYRYGGTTSLGFDCSGFVQRAYMDAFHKSLPRTTKAMMNAGKRINRSQLNPGDLVFFHPTRKYYHVGIYMGNGIFMHASSSKGVMKSKMDLKYWRRSYVTARRIL